MADAALSEPDIFLSYAREDETRARELATALEQRGFSVFWDREVPPGQTWHSYIGQALVRAKCVVVVALFYHIGLGDRGSERGQAQKGPRPGPV